jgi:homoaconitate hydratase
VQVMTSLAEMQQKKVAVHKAYLVSCVNSRLSDLEAAADVLRGNKVADGVELYMAAASREIQEAAEASGAWGAMLEAGAKPLSPGCGPCIGLGVGLLEAGEVGISATNRNFKGRMGSREAEAYLASPAVVASSALAGFICGPEGSGRELATSHQELDAPAAADETVSILPGFPERVQGRLVFVPADNLNTDGIYGKDYTYREDMTPEMMADVVMENYDPQFAGRTAEGDILVGGWNFGTGSSREQAVTSLQAKGLAMVVAASFSQTYLRNAFNNGFPCVQSAALVTRIKEQLAGEDGKTVIPGDELLVDFSSGAITWRGESFRFPPLGVVPQGLVVAGGVENQVRQKLAAG